MPVFLFLFLLQGRFHHSRPNHLMLERCQLCLFDRLTMLAWLSNKSEAKVPEFSPLLVTVCCGVEPSALVVRAMLNVSNMSL